MYIDGQFNHKDYIDHQTRRIGLGNLHYIVSDEIIIDIISFLSYLDICHISIVSRAFYVYSNYSDIWRNLTLINWENKAIRYHYTWHETFIHMWMSEHGINSSFPRIKPIKINYFYSNFLFRAFSCHSYDIMTACPTFMSYSNINTISCHLSIEEFQQEYENKNIPVILKQYAKDWNACKSWNKDYLIQSCEKSLTFRATSATGMKVKV